MHIELIDGKTYKVNFPALTAAAYTDVFSYPDVSLMVHFLATAETKGIKLFDSPTQANLTISGKWLAKNKEVIVKAHGYSDFIECFSDDEETEVKK